MNEFYFHTKQSPRVTISARVDGETMCFSAARCGKRDQFCRKTGRLIASGRLQKNKCIRTLTVPDNADTRQLFVTEAKTLASQVQVHKDFLNYF